MSQSAGGKENKRSGVSYVVFYVILVVAILAFALAIFLMWCMKEETKHTKAELEAIYASALRVASTNKPNIEETEKSINIIFNAPMITAANTSQDSVNNAMSLLQDQYNTHASNLSMILTVFCAGFTLFNIAVPLFNYFFLQKEQVDKIDRIVKESNEKVEQVMQIWNKEREDAKIELQNQMDLFRKSITQNEQATTKMVDDKSNIIIDPISDSDKDKARSFFLTGTLDRKQNKQDKALENLRKAVDLDPDNAYYHFALSVVHYEMGNHEQALDQSQEAVRLEPQNAKYRDGLGVILHKLKRYEEALIEEREAVRLEPENAKYRDSLSAVLHDIKRYEEALIEEKVAVRLEPENAIYRDSLGATLHILKRYGDALIERKEAVRLEPQNAVYIYGLGAASFRLKLYLDAYDYLTRSIEKDSKLDRAHVYLGLTKIRINLKEGKSDHAEAFKEIQKGIALKPDNSRNYRELAEGYLLVGNLDLAEEALKQAEQLDDKDPEIYHLYSILWEKRGDEPKAIEYQKKADELGYIPEPE